MGWRKLVVASMEWLWLVMFCGEVYGGGLVMYFFGYGGGSIDVMEVGG